jgi:penicillin G amidase
MSSNSHFVRYLLIAIVFVIFLTITFGWILLRGSLPQYEGRIDVRGLNVPVIVERDILGNATINGQNRLDVVRALGYVHAQERFFEMDLMRRQAAGELAELFGTAALANDLEVRQLRMRKRASAIMQQLPITQQQQLDIYTDGVNQGLHALSVRPYPYLLTQTKPAAWHSEDSLLVILAMFRILNESSIYRELGLSTMRSALPANVYSFLNTSGGSWDAPLIGAPFDWPALPAADDINIQILDPGLFKNGYAYQDSMPGSNNFAVSGALADGAALVANDMHMTLRVPGLWFRTRLIYSSSADASHDIIGVSLPGAPVIIIGSNRNIAWSFTNSYGDFADWVRITLDPDDEHRYLGASGWQSIQSSNEIIKVHNAPDETLIVRETEWGPIIATDHDEIPLALSWTALHPEAINLNLIELEHTKTADDAVKIARQAGIPVQNFIVGDHTGNISWTIAGRIPIRTGDYDPQLPADWSNPNTGWSGWLDPADYPLIKNPASQRLWTANARTVDNTMLNVLGDGGYDLGARAGQIRDNLFMREQFTPKDLYAVQLDHRAIFITRWYDLLESSLNQAEDTPLLSALKQSLDNWDGQASADSVAYRVVRAYRYEVIKTVLDGFAAEVRRLHPNFMLPRLSQAEHAVWKIIEQRPQHLLPPHFEKWDELLLFCATQIAEQLHSQSGGIAARNWGESNFARIKHPLSQNLPRFIANWLDMPPDPLPGDKNMPRVQSPDFGASQRSVVAPGKEEEGIFDMPGGQSGHPLSPYYGSGHSNWIAEKPTPFLPGSPDKILQLIPADTPSN